MTGDAMDGHTTASPYTPSVPPLLRQLGTAHTWDVAAELPVRYAIKQVEDLFDPDNPALLEYGNTARRLVVIDSRVASLYGERIARYFRLRHIKAEVLTLEASESVKDFPHAFTVVEALEAMGVNRRSEPLIAIGGGVLLDIAGFAASIYRRGVPYVRVPTNLMAIVDASVGVKTGVNCLTRRNRMGSYYAPIAAYLDRAFLATVDTRHLANGMGEIIKLAVIKDASLFDLIDAHSGLLMATRFQDSIVAPEVIRLSVQGMVEELAPNLWETELERVVDFGHSFSPMVEMTALPELLHGEAVGLDVLYSCILAWQRGWLEWCDVERVQQLMRRVGLPTHHPGFADVDLLERALTDTTRHRDGLQRLPLPVAIGRARFVNDLTRDEMTRAAGRMAEMTGAATMAVAA
jgi:2-epi-5-epi-valiolone synthase